MNEQIPQHNSQGDQQPGQEPNPAEVEASREQAPRPNPRIYITKGLPLRAELTTGMWLDMARDPRDIHAEMYAVLDDKASDGEGLYIWDYRDFGAFDITTGPIGLEGVDSIELLAQVARGIKEHGLAYAAWAKYNEDEPRVFAHFERAYQGHHESLAAYVRQQLAPLDYDAVLDRTLPAEIRPYTRIDYEAIGEEAFHRGDIVVFTADGGGVWIFDERV